MNELIQQKSFLIGAAEDIAALEKKERASILVISDSHGVKDTVISIITRQAKKELCDALVFCGDGASDILSALEQAAHDEEFMKYVPAVVVLVEGNGDCDRYPVRFDAAGKTKLHRTDSSSSKNEQSSIRSPLFLYSNVSVPQEVVFKTAGHTLFATHGHRYDVYYGTQELAVRAKALGADIALYGHTHISTAEDRNGILILNPGSCTRPRGGQTPSYAVVTLNASPKSYDCRIISLT